MHDIKCQHFSIRQITGKSTHSGPGPAHVGSELRKQKGFTRFLLQNYHFTASKRVNPGESFYCLFVTIII